MVKRCAVLAVVLAAAGCSCEQKFVPGEFAKGRMDGSRVLVIRPSEIKNLEGYCLVTVRTEAGRLENRTVEELEPM